MIDTLYTDGCSMTFGDEIVADTTRDEKRVPGGAEKRTSLTWPSHVGRLLNTNTVVNGAICGSANSQIMDRTLAWITTNYIMPGRPTDDLLVIINWSSASRRAFPLMGETRNIMSTSFDYGGYSRGLQRAKDIYRHDIRSGMYDLSEFYGQVFSMQMFLRAHSVKYTMATALHTAFDRYPRVMKESMLAMETIPESSLDQTVFYKGYAPDGAMRNWLTTNTDSKIGKNGHPMAVGHWHWGYEMAQFASERYKLSYVSPFDTK